MPKKRNFPFLLDRALHGLTFVAFDVETTGLFGLSARIVEIGAVRVKDGAVTQEVFWSMVNPQTPIPTDATSVHGIRDKDVSDAPTTLKVLPSFQEWVKEDILVAHNAPYDLEVLLTEFARMRVNPPTWICIDTCAWARMALNAENYKLSTLGRLLSIDKASYHRAREDARVTSFLFCALAESFGWEKSLEELRVALPGVVLFSDEMGARAEFELPEELSDLGRAFEEGSDVMMIYTGGTRGLAERRVGPRSILKRRNVLYLEAWCYETNQLKTFRLDRVLKVKALV